MADYRDDPRWKEYGFGRDMFPGGGAAPVASSEFTPIRTAGVLSDLWSDYIRPGIEWAGETIPGIGRSDTSSTETVEGATKLLRDMIDADEDSREDMDRLLRETEEYEETYKKISGEYDAGIDVAKDLFLESLRGDSELLVSEVPSPLMTAIEDAKIDPTGIGIIPTGDRLGTADKGRPVLPSIEASFKTPAVGTREHWYSLGLSGPKAWHQYESAVKAGVYDLREGGEKWKLTKAAEAKAERGRAYVAEKAAAEKAALTGMPEAMSPDLGPLTPEFLGVSADEMVPIMRAPYTITAAEHPDMEWAWGSFVDTSTPTARPEFVLASEVAGLVASGKFGDPTKDKRPSMKHFYDALPTPDSELDPATKAMVDTDMASGIFPEVAGIAMKGSAAKEWEVLDKIRKEEAEESTYPSDILRAAGIGVDTSERGIAIPPPRLLGEMSPGERFEKGVGSLTIPGDWESIRPDMTPSLSSLTKKADYVLGGDPYYGRRPAMVGRTPPAPEEPGFFDTVLGAASEFVSPIIDYGKDVIDVRTEEAKRAYDAITSIPGDIEGLKKFIYDDPMASISPRTGYRESSLESILAPDPYKGLTAPDPFPMGSYFSGASTMPSDPTWAASGPLGYSSITGTFYPTAAEILSAETSSRGPL